MTGFINQLVVAAARQAHIDGRIDAAVAKRVQQQYADSLLVELMGRLDQMLGDWDD